MGFIWELECRISKGKCYIYIYIYGQKSQEKKRGSGRRVDVEDMQLIARK